MSDLPRVPDGRYALRGPKGVMERIEVDVHVDAETPDILAFEGEEGGGMSIGWVPNYGIGDTFAFFDAEACDRLEAWLAARRIARDAAIRDDDGEVA